ncbi:disulfide bond formation protein B [Nitrincola tibetensis]|uniref:Disulfide bond formation protein B n=1 Tax=Nitrincola tibetensis TaxID=2219697 RepID=A0A364NRR6_9GAMM|nr:disulfide bond formation protein B [Nitrincola tibetensis]RAU19776.1 disulfide bond formation protein B [Nitrincola tibetensis]
MFSYRQLNFLGLVLCVSAMAFALLFLQNHLGLEPCPLCIVTRIIVISLAVVFLVAFLHNPNSGGQKVYAGLNLIIAIIGLGVQLRHVWLQSLPADEVPACGPGLEYLMDTLPLVSVLEHVFSGSGECAEIDWTFLGLSIPAQTALLFVVMLALILTILKKKTKRPLFG